MNLDLRILSVVVVILIVGASFCTKKYIEYKAGKDPYELLKDFTQTIIYTSQKSMEILNPVDYEDETEYRNHLAGIVAEEIYKELQEGDFSNILKLMPEESIKKAVLQVFALYKGEIKISESFNVKKIIEENAVAKNAATEAVSDDINDIPKGKVDILEEIKDIANQE